MQDRITTKVHGIRRAKANGLRLGRPKVQVDINAARRLKEEGLSYKAGAASRRRSRASQPYRMGEHRRIVKSAFYPKG